MTPNVPTNYRDALRGIVDREFLKTRKYRDQQWRAIRPAADPQILLFERLLVRRMLKIGVPMYATEVMRDKERQAELVKQKRSQLYDGPHMHGMAVDVVHSLKLWDMTKMQWDLIGHVGKEIIAQEGLSIRWGGDWKTLWDPAHWEREDWRNIPSELIPY